MAKLKEVELFAEDAPVVEVEPTETVEQNASEPEPQPQPKWKDALLAATTFCSILFFSLWVRTIDFGPGPSPGPNVDGEYVLIVYNDEDLSDYSQTQRDAISSLLIAKKIEELGAEFVKVDEDQLDELENLGDPWGEMSHEHIPRLPGVIIYTPKGKSNALIESADSLLRLLEEKL